MAELPGVLTVAQVARLFQVHDRTVRRWIRRGQINSIDLGTRAVRIRRAEVGHVMEHGLRPLPAHEGAKT